MIFKRKIPCYVVIYDQLDIIKRSLNFFTQYTNRLDLIIVENPSDNTPSIKKLLDDYGKKGLVKRHYLFDDNITGKALAIAIENEKEFVRKSKFVLMSDGDLETDNQSWLDEEVAILKKHPEVFACGTTLDMINLPVVNFPEATGWIPPDVNEYKDFYEVRTGAHLLLMRGQELLNCIEWAQENDAPFVDGSMHKYAYEVLGKKWARTKKAKAYHITWDLYNDKNHPYTTFKLSKSFKDMWYHKRNSGYTLAEY